MSGAKQYPRNSTFVTGDGTALHVVDSGPETQQTTILLVHGWTQDHRTWDRVVPGLPPGIRALRYDLRGHGASGPTTSETATIDRLADDLAELITHRVGSGKLVLAGHSLGGMTIMALAERHPRLIAERVTAVVFVATACAEMNRITLGLPKVLASVASRAAPVLARILARHGRGVLPLPPAAAGWGARWLVFGRQPRRADVRAVADQLLGAHTASVGRFQQAILEHDRRAGLAVLSSLPVRVLAGDRDRLCSVRHAHAIAAALSRARMRIYPGAGHMLPQERSQEILGELGVLCRDTATEAASVGDSPGTAVSIPR